MGTTLWSGWLQTSYGQIDLLCAEYVDRGEGLDQPFANQVNGLVGAAVPGYAYIHLAGWRGGVVHVELHGSEPPLRDEWEDIVEVSVTVPPGEHARLLTWGGDRLLELPGIGPGTYRLRESSRDRDAGHQDEMSGVHLLQFWKAPPAPDAILRTTSDSAAYWHKAWGTRREG